VLLKHGDGFDRGSGGQEAVYHSPVLQQLSKRGEDLQIPIPFELGCQDHEHETHRRTATRRIYAYQLTPDVVVKLQDAQAIRVSYMKDVDQRRMLSDNQRPILQSFLVDTEHVTYGAPQSVVTRCLSRPLACIGAILVSVRCSPSVSG